MSVTKISVKSTILPEIGLNLTFLPKLVSETWICKKWGVSETWMCKKWGVYSICLLKIRGLSYIT